jgi:hypothetical protein
MEAVRFHFYYTVQGLPNLLTGRKNIELAIRWRAQFKHCDL